MTFDEILSGSRATAGFKHDVLEFAEHRDAPRVRTSRHVPRVKVVRLLTQLLAAEPELRIERVLVDGWSGCSDFKGTVTVESVDGSSAFDFVWDCHWRAEQEGWRDAFDLPDQIRAAREYGWQCFSHWRARSVAPSRATATA